ncbi:protein charybde-like protein [Dinothrombium tinctorium]|uniref:Protein charybde-like protein n=1 Tax=Dinothrombium tinctorium TaxID=1965070 RepID=A0A3S3SJF1_9ACAR|nr:protein charybde-like protein [Dinothrombium tinctorium]
MIESPNRAIRNGSHFSKLVSKVGDIFRGHHPQKTATMCPTIDASLRRSSDVINLADSDNDSLAALIAENLEIVLREAKLRTLGSCRFLMPSNLSQQVAEDIIGMSESEPCGLRGCLLYIIYEDKEKCCRMTAVKFGDRTIVPTFEMYLYLKRKRDTWRNLVPNLILSHLLGDSIIISDAYKLSKKKLYRSSNS